MKLDDSTIDRLVRAGDWDSLLDAVLATFDCPTGTIHTLEPASNTLKLAAQRGIPPQLLDKISNIPVGKGIAGAAAERREAVQLCNLQTDDSGVARPDAKQTQVAGSLAIPLQHNNSLRGTLGIGKFVPYDFNDTEIDALWKIGNHIAAAMQTPITGE